MTGSGTTRTAVSIITDHVVGPAGEYGIKRLTEALRKRGMEVTRSTSPADGGCRAFVLGNSSELPLSCACLLSKQVCGCPASPEALAFCPLKNPTPTVLVDRRR